MPETELNLVAVLRDVVKKNCSETDRILSALEKKLEEEKMKPDDILTELLLEAAAESLKLIVELKSGENDPEIMFAGSDLCERLGYLADELTGKPLSLVVPDEAREKHKSYVAEFIKSPKDRRMGEGLKVTAKKKDGGTIPVSVLLKTKAKFDPSVIGKTRYFTIATILPLEA